MADPQLSGTDLQFSGVVIEQLNAAQWHPRYPDGQAGGVGDWLSVLIDALNYASLYGCPVASVDLDAERLLILRTDLRLTGQAGAA